MFVTQPCVQGKGQGLSQPFTTVTKHWDLASVWIKKTMATSYHLSQASILRGKDWFFYILAEKKRQESEGHIPVLKFCERKSQESRALNSELALRKHSQDLPRSKTCLNHSQFKAMSNPRSQCWDLEPSQSTVWGMGTFQTDSLHRGLAG